MKTTQMGLWTLATAVLMTADFVSAQTWTQTSAPNTNWSCIASSADGTKLVAATSISISNANGIWISTNAGYTWTQTSAPGLDNWYHTASSADGTKLAAVAYNGLYTSADSGTTWVSNNINIPNPVGSSLALSADGTKLVAAATYPVTNEYIFTSVDSGATWVSNTIPASSAVFVACPANGSKLVAAVNYPGQIFTSTNMGANWESANFPFRGAALYSIASSADGSTWVAGGGALGGNGIFVTTNSGATWVSNSVLALGGVDWISCAASADGSTLVAVAMSANLDLKGASLIFTSTNFGASWTQADAPVKNWTCVAASADGHELIGSAPPDPFTPYQSAWTGGIYLSQTTPAPRINVTPTNGNLLLSWIIPSTNFVLEQNSDLTTANWTDVTNVPVLNFTNLQDEVTLPLPASNCFYRLAAQ